MRRSHPRSRLPLAAGLIAVLAARAVAAPCVDRSGAGFATSYSYVPGSGACSFTGDDFGSLVAAANPVDYAGSKLCGSYVQVTGPLGSVAVRIVDLCPSCAAGDLDLNAAAFGSIANPGDRRVPITWRTTADPAPNDVFVQQSAGTNTFLLQIQPRDGLYGIASVEYLAPSGYVSAHRESYNYFTVDGSVAPVPLASPFTLRVTDVNGQAMVVPGIPLAANHLHPTNAQFPPCDPLGVPAAPRDAALLVPAPNPFQRSTAIAFDLAREADATLRLYDAGGRRVRTLVRERLAAGRHLVTWDGADEAGRRLPAGQYFCRLTAGAAVDQRRITLAD